MSRVFSSSVLLLTIAAGPVWLGAMEPARDGEFTRNGIVLHYRIIGAKGSLAVILAGGPGGDPGYVQPVVDELSKSYQCVVFEQRGTGRSKLATYDAKNIAFEEYLKDLEALRIHLGQSKLLLVGHSWGGMLGLSYAGTYPNRVRALVSIDSGPIAEEHAVAEEANGLRRLLPAERDQVEKWEQRKAADPFLVFAETLRLMMSAYFYNPKRAEDSLHWMTPQLNMRVMWLGYQPAFGSLHEFIRARLSAVKAPVLLIHGRQDPVAEAGVAEAHQLIRRSRLILINECGHMPWIEQPEQLWKAVHSFLASLPK